MNTEGDNLIAFHPGWGKHIRNKYNLWHDGELVKSLGAHHPLLLQWSSSKLSGKSKLRSQEKQMGRYYKKNAYSSVNRTRHIGAQRAERESLRETNQRLPPRGREQKGRKCHKCGIMLKDPRLYIIDWINQNLQALCIECYAEKPGENHWKLRERRTYKRFMERYGKEWQRRCQGLKSWKVVICSEQKWRYHLIRNFYIRLYS